MKLFCWRNMLGSRARIPKKRGLSLADEGPTFLSETRYQLKRDSHWERETKSSSPPCEPALLLTWSVVHLLVHLPSVGTGTILLLSQLFTFRFTFFRLFIVFYYLFCVRFPKLYAFLFFSFKKVKK
jgi:hypothetical protein